MGDGRSERKIIIIINPFLGDFLLKIILKKNLFD